MGRRGWLVLMIGMCAVAATVRATDEPARTDFRAAMRQARDADLQADWNKLLDARERFVSFAKDEDLAAMAHYYEGYTDWRLSSLAYITLGPSALGRLAERAVSELELAVQKRPQFAEAHALLATCLAAWLYADRSLSDKLIPRIKAAWESALQAVNSSPRVTLLRAMALTWAPPPYGDREKGLALWRQAIQMFPADHPEGLMPDWGDVEAVAWLGGTMLTFDRPEEAVDLLERAVKMRPDFWWASKAALPMARRPMAPKTSAASR